MKKVIVLLMAIIFTLQGCSTLKVEKHRAEVKLDREKLNKIVESAKQIRAIKPQAKRITVERGKEWIYQQFSATTSANGLRETMISLAQGFPVVFAIKDNYNPRITSSRNARTIKDHFNSIELQANVGIMVAQGVVLVTKTKTKQYKIPVFGSFVSGSAGVISMQLSSDNLQRVAGAGSVSGFSNNVIGNINPYKEISEIVMSTIPTIRKCGDSLVTPELIKRGEVPDCYSLGATGNSLTITAKPRDHERFNQVYREWLTSATRQASVSIKILEIDVTDLAQQKFDINLVRNGLVQTSFNNATGGLVDILDSGGFLTFEFLDPALYLSGTQGVIQALSKISEVSVVDEKDFQLHNNRLKTDRDFGTTRYIEQATIQNTSGGSLTTTTPSVKVGEISTGTAINILPTISDDMITMHIVINSAEVNGFNPYDFGNGQLTGSFPNDVGKDDVFDITLKDSQMVMLSSTKRKVVRVEKGQTDFMPIIGDSRKSEKRIIQRVYLIQGRVIDG